VPASDDYERWKPMFDQDTPGARAEAKGHRILKGSRLTELASLARMTLPAMSELVDDLQRLGIVERRPDPSDGRAKLICLTDAGWEAMRTARGVIAEIEADYAQLVGVERFEAAAQTLDELLRGLASRRAE
jgi:DNA-binding MarR family transcriptional regulator